MVVIKILFAHFGDNTMLMMSMREVFMIRSLGVVWDREGEAFTWGTEIRQEQNM